jgi:hypothetical protein
LTFISDCDFNLKFGRTRDHFEKYEENEGVPLILAMGLIEKERRNRFMRQKPEKYQDFFFLKLGFGSFGTLWKSKL